VPFIGSGDVIEQGSQTHMRAALRGKMSPRATIGGKKCFYTTKNRCFSKNLSNFNDVAGRTNTSGGPRVARGTRV